MELIGLHWDTCLAHIYVIFRFFRGQVPFACAVARPKSLLIAVFRFGFKIRVSVDKR